MPRTASVICGSINIGQRERALGILRREARRRWLLDAMREVACCVWML
jgi:hypothetical protein